MEVNRSMRKESFYNENYSFRPSINRSSSEKPSLQNFFVRLQSWKDKMNDNYDKDIKKSLMKDDGTPLFKPTILTSHESYSSGRQIFDKLYDGYKTKIQKEQMMVEKYIEDVKKTSDSKLASDKTNKINEKLKKIAFEKLFERLNVNNDETIQYSDKFEEAINSLNSPEIENYLNPLITELREQKETLNKKEFFLAMDHLFELLNVCQRRLVVEFFNEEKKEKQNIKKQLLNTKYSFRPKINNDSKWLKKK